MPTVIVQDTSLFINGDFDNYFEEFVDNINNYLT